MIIRFRQILTILLLLLFSSEQLFATSTEGGSEKSTPGYCISLEEGLMSVDLLAEENETRDDKFDSVEDSIHERGFTGYCLAACLAVEKYRSYSFTFLDSGALPRYKFLRSFLI